MVFDEGTLSFNDGVFVFTLGTHNADGIIYHESKVSAGTWSFDLFYPEDVTPDYEVVLSCDQEWDFGFSIYLMTMKNTMLSIRTYSHGIMKTGESAGLGQKLTGWNHFDITRDDSGHLKLYLNGELILDNKDELAFSPQFFGVVTFHTGPVFDNLVVRNQVIDIQPAETE